MGQVWWASCGVGLARSVLLSQVYMISFIWSGLVGKGLLDRVWRTRVAHRCLHCLTSRVRYAMSGFARSGILFQVFLVSFTFLDL